jgi:hypothetical protein
MRGNLTSPKQPHSSRSPFHDFRDEAAYAASAAPQWGPGARVGPDRPRSARRERFLLESTNIAVSPSRRNSCTTQGGPTTGPQNQHACNVPQHAAQPESAPSAGKPAFLARFLQRNRSEKPGGEARGQARRAGVRSDPGRRPRGYAPPRPGIGRAAASGRPRARRGHAKGPPSSRSTASIVGGGLGGRADRRARPGRRC